MSHIPTGVMAFRLQIILEVTEMTGDATSTQKDIPQLYIDVIANSKSKTLNRTSIVRHVYQTQNVHDFI